MSTRNRASGRPVGQQLDSLRRANAAAVLSEVRAHGSVSRSEIALNVGLSPAAITTIIAALEQTGYIAESVVGESVAARPRGRPRRPLGLDLSRHRFVGLHVGVQRVTAGLVDLDGAVVELRSRQHSNAAPATVLAAAKRLVRQVVERSGASSEDIVGFGACIGGWLDDRTGAVRDFEGLGWHDVGFAEAIALDGLPVPQVESTVRALAMAEAAIASRTGVHNMLYLFVGNVVGCAHGVHGTIARGQHGAAGLIDHMDSGFRSAVPCTCGRRDCLWAVASDKALALTAQQRGLLPDGATVEDLVRAAGATGTDARDAQRLLDQRADRVGPTVAALIGIHDPDLVVVGGGDLASSPERFDRLVAAITARAAPGRPLPPVRPALLVGPTGLVQGAAAPAVDAFYADPLGPRELMAVAGSGLR